MSPTASGRASDPQQAPAADRQGGLHARIRSAADSARSTRMPDLPFSAYRRFDDDGDRLAYEELYFRRRALVTALAAEALLDPEAGLGPLQDALWSVCDEYTWALPAHEMHATRLDRGMDQCLDLFAALTAQMLAETVQVCGDRLHPGSPPACATRWTIGCCPSSPTTNARFSGRAGHTTGRPCAVVARASRPWPCGSRGRA